MADPIHLMALPSALPSCNLSILHTTSTILHDHTHNSSALHKLVCLTISTRGALLCSLAGTMSVPQTRSTTPYPEVILSVSHTTYVRTYTHTHKLFTGTTKNHVVFTVRTILYSPFEDSQTMPKNNFLRKSPMLKYIDQAPTIPCALTLVRVREGQITNVALLCIGKLEVT